MNEIDKAEFFQAIKAFYIPSSLFIACLLAAAGIFLLQEGYMLGWAFITLSAVCIGTAFAAFMTFQNKLRARGLMKDQFDSPAPEQDADLPTSIESIVPEELGSRNNTVCDGALKS